MSAGGRAMVAAWLSLGTLLAAPACSGGEDGEGDVQPVVQAHGSPLRDDVRVAPLVRTCPQPGLYDRNLSDPVSILVGKLDAGFPDPMHLAKAELAEMGDPALEAIQRLFDRSFADPVLAPQLQNALDVAVRMKEPGVRDLLLRAVAHPRDAARDLGLQGLVINHVRPEDFDTLAQHVEVEVSPRLRGAFAASLYAADPLRAAHTYLDWVAEGSHTDSWEAVLSTVILVDADEVDVRCAQLWPDTTLVAQHFLAAAAARGGDGAADAFLRAELAHEDQGRRTRALQGLAAIGRHELLPAVLATDPDPLTRLSAASSLAALPDDEEASQALRAALDDPDPDLRKYCYQVLCARGDEIALERAFAGLRGSYGDLRGAVDALRGAWAADPALAVRTLETLQLRWRDEADLPWKDKLATLQAIGLLPLREAAEWLFEKGSEPEGQQTEVLGMARHGWLCMQVANTGAAGRALLSERLAEEADPVRRLDLLVGLASARDAFVRETLIGIVEDEEVDPFERLYVAERLAHVGPSSIVAPVLKRVALRIEHPEVRRAMACLLWMWY